jgi:hypothetical protein
MLVYRRGPSKVKADYKFDEIYKFYSERYGESSLPRDVVMKIYSKLFPAIVKLIIFENLDYRMPARMGYLRVKKKLREPKIDENGNLDTRGLSIDYKKTKRMWEKLYPGKTAEEIKAISGKPVVRELNEDNGGYRLLWFWDKTVCNIPNQNAYYVNLTRSHDQMLSRGAKLNNINFYE